uniref:C2H2-type domain-containing protein n=1 Tax=Physcomitrium patens TaxID=3218 RepID=A0A7I4FJL4_PHYPA
MDFWGVEVPAGKPISCSPGEGMYLHVSQVALGESKVKGGKGNDRVVLKVQVDDSEVVLGTLSEGKCDQMQLDLVFDREFKVSHNSSSSSVYICGYRTEGPEEHGSEDEDEDEDEEDGALAVATIPVESNGSKIIKEVTDKAATDVAKVVEKAMQDKSLKKQVVPDGDSDEEDDEEDSDDALKGTPTAPPPTPVSEKKAGPHQCTGCDRTFTTESAMSQHIAAKHKS